MLLGVSGLCGVLGLGLAATWRWLHTWETPPPVARPGVVSLDRREVSVGEVSVLMRGAKPLPVTDIPLGSTVTITADGRVVLVPPPPRGAPEAETEETEEEETPRCGAP